MRPADASDWALLRAELWPNAATTTSLAEMERMLADDWCCLIARSEAGAPVGFIETGLRRDYVEGCETSPVAFIEGIYVRPGWRRHGVARALVAGVEAWARGRVTELASDAALDNTRSHRFHEAVGFAETRRVVYFRKVLD